MLAFGEMLTQWGGAYIAEERGAETPAAQSSTEDVPVRVQHRALTRYASRASYLEPWCAHNSWSRSIGPDMLVTNGRDCVEYGKKIRGGLIYLSYLLPTCYTCIPSEDIVVVIGLMAPIC